MQLRSKEDSPEFVRKNLDPSRIRLQRERRGWTGKKLAKKVGVSPSAISQIERGVSEPGLDTLVDLGAKLDVPIGFFLDRESNTQIGLDRCHFRSKRGVAQYERRQSISDASLLIQLATVLVKDYGIQFPEEKISGFADQVQEVDKNTPVEKMEDLAVQLRDHWELGRGPIPDLVSLLESKGAFVFPLPDSDYEDVDAFSVWHEGRPVVLLGHEKAASRDRLDAAHELCHLALHSDAERDLKVIEDQAFRFGGAFLAPRESFLPECPSRWSRKAFLRLKERWRMSMQALARRAYDLGKLSESSYRRANIELRKRFAANGEEEGEWEPERPSMIQQAIELLKDEVTLRELAHSIGVHGTDLRDLLSKIVDDSVLGQIDTGPSAVDEKGQFVTRREEEE
ncbi:Zn-dependent peptidase ImmA (M78 family)/DNA-binding XRE family transcriptional regulator [Salinibacter ruber]|uniref:helix-turn-helix domain-containing protein n=1 Tax=Salinibacter ruber TaxID=146919 RepID=UPI002167E22C|nr:helix-turn-helix domain-containing protein [Salinibacter ruber]MCS3856459.1 Zn-dependent peptidase ImmA (M78 family)/DNA-binding XRE family transcriptional regulator [Salinibacter ruber]